MIKSIKFVLNEHINNLYRIFTITRYEILTENRDTRIGFIWNIINPIIQILTYWMVFGTIRKNKPIEGVEFFPWLIAGIVVWFYLNPCILEGTSSIHSKASILTKIKFPISIIPITKILEETFNHICMLAIAYIVLMTQGVKPSIYNLQIIYYLLASIMFATSLALVTSVLNMFTRDVKKAIRALMRTLFYATPILWTMEDFPPIAQFIMECNPIYYIVQGYRESLLYNTPISLDSPFTIIFWIITITLFVIGSSLMFKFRHKFIDMM
ncbi:MAG: ABC transporter permease [Clostridium sp.]